MRVGIISSPWISVPPPAYGGTEAMVDNLCRSLSDLGHHVRLATVGESTCPVDRVWHYQETPGPIGETMSEVVHVRAAYEALAGTVDVIHDHTTLGPQFLAGTVPAHVPVVTTNHGPFTDTARCMFARRPARVALIAISRSQRATAPEVKVDAVIPHGIDLDQYRFGADVDDYAVFIGRMTEGKGPDRAITVARRAGMRLVLVAKMREPQEVAYFEERVRPLLGPDVEMAGEAEAPVRAELLRHARALINPIRWPEPFGLVMTEALASGTPVVALANGSAAEIVDDGLTGFLCCDEEEMVTALSKVEDLSREACRAAAEQRFSRLRMGMDHERLYERLLVAASRERLPADKLVLDVSRLRR